MNSFQFDQVWLLGSVGFVLVVLLIAFRAQVKELVNEQLTSVRRNESMLLEVTTAISAEIQLLPLLQKVIETVTEILDADRSTLFLHDSRTDEIWSQVAEGVETREIRFPSHLGIAGSVFTSGETINIKDAYSDDRFNKAVDKKTGYRTRSILCMRICTKNGIPIGVVQVLNKNTGVFNRTDEDRLTAFSAQAAIAIENAKLFNEVVNIKNYNEAMIESMSSGVLSVDEKGRVVKSNSAFLALIGMSGAKDFLGGLPVSELFVKDNQWIAECIHRVLESGVSDETMDVSIVISSDTSVSSKVNVNINVQPLNDSNGVRIGGLITVEDITQMKRLRSTMSRYMTKELADRLLEDGEQALGGSLQQATILFSDIRSFTSFSERNGPQETVKMLNDYFGEMFDLIGQNNGILDKYIGDAIMAVFGVPFTSENDADNALNTGIQMIQRLRDFNMKRVSDGKEAIHVGIGINTGQVVSGNIGSSKRMDYTVIGDGVNLAARLEGATKEYKTALIVSELTVNALTKSRSLRELDRIRVKGKAEPVAIFEVIDALAEEQKNHVERILPLHVEGLASYRECSWQAAREKFTQVLEIHPDDVVAQIYMKRCLHFVDEPPSNDWDGVWNMTNK